VIGLGTLLTKGLGGDATALILGRFRLFIGVEVGPPVTPPAGGGAGGTGGRWAGSRHRDQEEPRRPVIITIKLKDRKWRQEYLLDEPRAAAVVKAINFINVARQRLSVGVQNLQQAARKITAAFTPKDK